MVIFGDREEEEKLTNVRVEKNMKRVKEIVNKLDTEGNSWGNEIEEVKRIGIYKKGESRPFRVKFNNERTVHNILKDSWKLSKVKGYERLMIRKDLNEEEREKLKMMKDQVKVKNEERSEEERKVFFWRIKDMRVRKWYIKN